MWSTILGDPGEVSRGGKKGAKKAFKHGQKSPWVPAHQTISNKTVKRMLAPDWAQKKLGIILPNRPTESHEFFLCDRTRRLLSRQKKKENKNKTQTK